MSLQDPTTFTLEGKDCDYSDAALPDTNGTSPKTHKGVYFFGALAALGGASGGFDMGIIGGIMGSMELFNERFLGDESERPYRSGLFVSLMLLGATIGGLSSGTLCASWAFALGCVFETIGYNFALILVGRLCVGLGQGSLTNAVPLYHAEIAPPAIRGRLITLYSAASSMGVVLGYFVTFGTSNIDNDWSWRIPFLINLVLCLVISFAFVLPFSPRWLIDKDRLDEARQVIAKLYQLDIEHPAVTQEFGIIFSEIQHERAFGNRTYLELFRGTNLRRTAYAFFVGNGAAFTGSAAIVYYSPQIMQQAGLSEIGISLVASGACNIVSFIFTVLSMTYIDLLGRKLALGTGAFIMAATMFVMGGLFQGYNTVLDDQGNVGLWNVSARNCVITLIFIFQASYAYSWGPVGYIYPAEIMNQRTRAKGMALAYGFNWPVALLFTFVVPIFMANTIYGGYYFFAGTCTLLFIGHFFIPETKGYSLEQIDRMFNPLPELATDTMDAPSIETKQLPSMQAV
ncbi:hypothetical protein [Absidia glauca]|uniref:Major facilitator superfamily (MFS) profile domain-containing protein n=1 Tax=Absidia glauca TaxID=4829 RepID=A0A168N524_ABSGL|nr:hypothetical protein [Absidia glauca]